MQKKKKEFNIILTHKARYLRGITLYNYANIIIRKDSIRRRNENGTIGRGRKRE